MNLISKFWYHLTAYVPRKLPDTPAKYARMQYVLVHAFGLPDDAPIWALVSGQINSQPAHSLRMAWGNIANAAKRIAINDLANNQRKQALAVLQQRLADATTKHSKLMAGVEKIFNDHPDLYKEALADDADALDILAEQAQELFPEAGATPEQWCNFIKNQAVHKNVADQQKESGDGKQGSEELKASDADPGTPQSEKPAAKQALGLPAEGVGKRGGQARGPKGSA